MKLHYDPETDRLYIELKSTPGARVAELRWIQHLQGLKYWR